MAEPLKALTIWRPWSWAISHSTKRVENRDWRPPARAIGAYLAIHAGKTYDSEAAYDIEEITGTRPPARENCAEGIVALARISGVAESFEDATRLCGDDQAEWFCGAFGWLLSDVTPIDPVPCRGAQGLWTVPPVVLAEVRLRFAAARKAREPQR